jgi:predicted anti-sigma-YlaC factor YlaD
MTCDDYFEDPEKNAAHLQSCAACRAMTEDLDGSIDIEPRPVRVDALPLAAWEGASHRTWPLVAAGAASVLILTVVLFLAAGTPPLRGIARAVASSVTSYEATTKFFQHVGSGLHGAPALVHVVIAVLFVVINTILFLLLRRAPKGIDV